MTLYQEMLNMIKISSVKSNRAGSFKDFCIFVDEFAQTHNRLFNFIDNLCLKKGQYKRFLTKAYKQALEYHHRKFN